MKNYIWILEHWINDDLDEVLGSFGNPGRAKQFAEEAFPDLTKDWDGDEWANCSAATDIHRRRHEIIIVKLEHNPDAKERRQS